MAMDIIRTIDVPTVSWVTIDRAVICLSQPARHKAAFLMKELVFL